MLTTNYNFLFSENKIKYIMLYADYVLNKKIKTQVRAF